LLAFANVHAFSVHIRHLPSFSFGIASLALQAGVSRSADSSLTSKKFKSEHGNFNELVEVLIEHFEDYLASAKSRDLSRTKSEESDLASQAGFIERFLDLNSCNFTDFGSLASLECLKEICKSVAECNEALPLSLRSYVPSHELTEKRSILTQQDRLELGCQTEVCLYPNNVTLSLQSAAHPQSVEVVSFKDTPLSITLERYDAQYLDVAIVNSRLLPYHKSVTLKLQVKLAQAKVAALPTYIGSLSYEDLELRAKAAKFARLHSHSTVRMRLCDDQGKCSFLDLKVVFLAKFTGTKRVSFGIVPVSTRESRYVSITNPFTTSMSFKLYIGPPLEELMNLAAGCMNSKPPMLDEDEFEVKYSTSTIAKAKACQTIIESEFSKVRPSKVTKQKKVIFDTSLMGKLQTLYAEAKNYFVPTTYHTQTHPFHLQESILQELKPGETLLLGPILYHPIVEGHHNATLYIKNNHTILDTIDLAASAELPAVILQLPGRSSRDSISVQIEWPDLASKIDFAYDNRHYPIFKFLIAVELANPNHVPVVVHSLHVGGVGCSAYGLTIPNCDQQIILKGKETVRLELQYTPKFDQELSVMKLFAITESGVEVTNLEVRVPYHMLSYIRWRRFSWLVWEKFELVVTELVILLSAMLGGGVFALLIWVDWWILREARVIPHEFLLRQSEFKHSETQSTGMQEIGEGDSPSPPKVEMTPDHETSASETCLTPKIKPAEDTSNAETPAPEPLNVSLKQRKPPKKKIKEAKIHVEFKANQSQKPAVPEQKVIATNQLIMQSKSKKHKMTDMESDTSTSFAEQAAALEEDLDLYLDMYKLNKLFSGPSLEWVSQQELHNN